jgi:CheY-like chemotaxis protein
MRMADGFTTRALPDVRPFTEPPALLSVDRHHLEPRREWSAARAIMPDPRPLFLLIVDDHPDTAEATAQLLALHGHDTRAAHSCAEARRAVSGDPPFVPDVVLLDLALPDGDGLALATELCALLPIRPVLIALTGRTGLEERCRAAGFNFYLLKPADPAALAQLIAQTPRS